MCEVIWLIQLLEELRIPIENPIRFYCDNKVAVNIAHNLMHYDKKSMSGSTIKEKIDNRSVCMTYLLTKPQVVDILTKSLSKPSFEV